MVHIHAVFPLREFELTITTKANVIVKLKCCIYYHAVDLLAGLLNIVRYIPVFLSKFRKVLWMSSDSLITCEY